MSIVFDTQLRSLEVVLDSPVTDFQLPVIITFSTILNDVESFRTQLSQTNGTTAVTVLQPPKNQTRLAVKFISIYNKDTVASTVILRYNDNGALSEIVKITLDPGDTLFYSDQKSFKVLDNEGRIKVAPLE